MRRVRSASQMLFPSKLHNPNVPSQNIGTLITSSGVSHNLVAIISRLLRFLTPRCRPNSPLADVVTQAYCSGARDYGPQDRREGGELEALEGDHSQTRGRRLLEASREDNKKRQATCGEKAEGCQLQE
jgi:hypothetical protein